MSFSTSLNKLITSRSPQQRSALNNSEQLFGKVVDIILDETHPSYIQKGGAASINGVFYIPLKVDIQLEDNQQPRFAYQSKANIKVVPTIGEIVRLKQLVAPSLAGNTFTTKLYYLDVVNVWNSPNSNPIIDFFNNSTLDTSFNNTFEQQNTVNPLRSAPGDVQLEGRQGQSIRFTGAIGQANPWIDSTNIGKPITIISNGQEDTDEGFTTISENVDEDFSSIYLTSDHLIPLTQASTKYDTYQTAPIASNQYKGNQVLINGGRLFFNAKEESIILSSVDSIGLTTLGTVNIDSTDFTCIDGSQIFLGEKAKTASQSNKEPVLLGNQTENFLNSILNLMEGMANDMGAAKTIEGKPIPLLNKRGMQMKPIIATLKRQINPSGPSTLKSKKVFTE